MVTSNLFCFFFFSKILPQPNNKSGLFGNLLKRKKTGEYLITAKLHLRRICLKGAQLRIFGKKVGYSFPNISPKIPDGGLPFDQYMNSTKGVVI